jgi:hypothetical protein
MSAADDLAQLLDLARSLPPAKRPEAIDFIRRLRQRGADAAGTFEDAQAWLASLPEEDVTPEEAAAIDAAKAEDQAGARRWTLEDLEAKHGGRGLAMTAADASWLAAAGEDALAGLAAVEADTPPEQVAAWLCKLDEGATPIEWDEERGVLAAAHGGTEA